MVHVYSESCADDGCGTVPPLLGTVAVGESLGDVATGNLDAMGAHDLALIDAPDGGAGRVFTVTHLDELSSEDDPTVTMIYETTDPAVFREIIVGDIVGNARPDIAVSQASDDNDQTVEGVLVFRNAGAGAFADPIIVPLDPAGVTGVAWGDLDCDGHADIVAGGGTNLWVVRGNGRDFEAPVSLTDAPIGGVAVGDYDADDRPDIAVTIINPAGLRILMHDE